MAITNDIVTKFSFKGSLTKLEKFKTLSKDGIALASKVGLGVSAAATGMFFLAKSGGEAAENLERLHQRTGINTQKFMQMRLHAVGLGADVGDLGNAVDTLSQKWAELQIDPSSLKSTPYLMNILAQGKGNTFKELKLIGKELEGKAPAVQDQLLTRWGISTNLLNPLLHYKKLFGKGGAYASFVPTKAQIKTLGEFNAQVKEFGLGMKGLKMQIGADIAPQMEKMMLGLANALEKHRKEISGVLSWLAGHPISGAIGAAYLGSGAWHAVLHPIKSGKTIAAGIKGGKNILLDAIGSTIAALGASGMAAAGAGVALAAYDTKKLTEHADKYYDKPIFTPGGVYVPHYTYNQEKKTNDKPPVVIHQHINVTTNGSSHTTAKKIANNLKHHLQSATQGVAG